MLEHSTLPVETNFDFSSKWSEASVRPGLELQCDGLHLLVSDPQNVQIATGNVGAAMHAAKLDSAPAGWPDIVVGPSYAVRLSRDRVMLVNALSLTEGWDHRGFGISRSESAGIVVEVRGKKLSSFLSRGAEISPGNQSASATRLFAGFAVVLYRFLQDDQIRIHISRPLAPAFFTWCRLNFEAGFIGN